MARISYQLYCSRNFPPLGNTLKMLATAGFSEVEGYGGLFDDLQGLQAGLDENGLRMTSSHMGLDLVGDNPGRAISIANQLGIEKVFVPFIGPDERPTNTKGWINFAEGIAEMGKPLQDAGLTFGWHNHDFELNVTETGEMPLDLLVQGSPDMTLELDLGWVRVAGQDPVAWINKYAGRLSAVHIKDIAQDGDCVDEDGWADVGHGIMDWPAIHAALRAANVDHYVVEHDNPSDDTRFATRSLASAQAF